MKLENEIYVIDILNGVRKHLKFIILFTIVCMGISIFVNKFVVTPEYNAVTTMIIGKTKSAESDKNIEYNDLMVNQKLVTTYSEIIKSKMIEEQVIKNLKLDLEYEQMKNMVEVNTVKETEIIHISVNDTDPQRAMKIANETADVFKKEIKNIMSIDNVIILEDASKPEKPLNPNVVKRTALVGIVAFTISCIYAIYRELTDSTFRKPEELQERYGIPVIGIIPDMKRGK